MQGFSHNQPNWDHLSIDWAADFLDSSGNTPQHRGEHYCESGAQSNEDPSENGKKKISDALVYGPRFCTIFETYTKTFDLQVDINRHLMSLCMEHLITFVKWSRETVPQWIAATLLENECLRPEVRNGIVVVLVYTFASIKATVDDSSDMFITLQDNESGLGIANKFSLKIYNDPFNYLSFLKTSISALIDAGAIPDNERLNQPKRYKTQYQNREEINAYQKIQKQLVEYLDSGNIVAARNMVTHITSFWQQRGKFVRNRRFTSALAALSQPMSSFAPSAFDDQANSTINSTTGKKNSCSAQSDEDSSDDVMDVVVKGSGVAVVASSSSNKRSLSDTMPPATHTTGAIAVGAPAGNTAQPGAKRQNTNASSRGDSIQVMQLMQAHGQGQVQSLQANDTSSTKQMISHHHTSQQYSSSAASAAATSSNILASFSLPALRFERTSWQEWEVKETRIYDLPSFVTAIRRSKHESAICLLDESILVTELQNMKLERKCNNTGGLEQELLSRKALITSWPVSEMAQFQSFLSSYAQYNAQYNSSESGSDGALSLIGYWRRQQAKVTSSSTRPSFMSTATSSSPSSSNAIGYIAYEVPVTIIIILRRNDSLSIHEDIWCTLYPAELTAIDMNQTFGSFMTSLFPQLLSLEKTVMNAKEQESSRFPLQGREITIKYYAHKRDIAADMISSSTSSNHVVNSVGVEGDVNVPKLPPLHGYQTIGTYAAPAAKVIARLNAGPLLHDFMLEHRS